MTSTGAGRVLWWLWGYLALEGTLLLLAVLFVAPVLTAAAGALAFAVTVVALVVRRPPRRAAWWSLTVASALAVGSRILGTVVAEPSSTYLGLGTADIRALVYYAAVVVGLLLLTGLGRDSDLADTLDAAVAALGLFLLLWIFLLNGRLVPPGADLLVTAVRPIGVAIVTGVLARLLFVVRVRSPSFVFLSAAIVFTLCGAVAVIWQSVGYPVTRAVTDTGVLFAAYAALLGAAVLHPSLSRPLLRREESDARLSRARAALFVVLTLLGPLAWLVAVTPTPFSPGSLENFALPVMSSAAISLLLLWRLSLIAKVSDRRAGQLGVAVIELKQLHTQLTPRPADRVGQPVRAQRSAGTRR